MVHFWFFLVSSQVPKFFLFEKTYLHPGYPGPWCFFIPFHSSLVTFIFKFARNQSEYTIFVAKMVYLTARMAYIRYIPDIWQFLDFEGGWILGSVAKKNIEFCSETFFSKSNLYYRWVEHFSLSKIYFAPKHDFFLCLNSWFQGAPKIIKHRLPEPIYSKYAIFSWKCSISANIWPIWEFLVSNEFKITGGNTLNHFPWVISA